MADINKADIKLLQSQRLDDTPQGGGQMTSKEVVDGQVNNLFPDISRLDRVYGRVSLRKAYLAVQTASRETYYGSHTILTEQVADPNVSVCFFSNKDWFSTREEAKDRIEAYLVRGPHSNLKFWGNHYAGTSLLKFITIDGWPVPEIGDVLVVVASESGNAEQYVRVTDVSHETQEFFSGVYTQTSVDGYYRNVVTIQIGTQLKYDMRGSEVYQNWTNISGDDVFTTVAADASRYYGVARLQEDCNQGELQFRVNDIQQHLVPSAASETAVTDAGVGNSVAPMLQTRDPEVTITRSIQYKIAPNAKLHLGEGVLPGSFSWTGGISINDGNGQGNIYNGSLIVGSIAYATGIITFGQPGVTTSGTGVATYTPACTPQQVSETGGIIIETNNRGFVYTFNCNPIPMVKTLKVEYLAGGKWYSIWDIGNGQLKNTLDVSIGSGSVNFQTGSVSVTLGAMPDVGSKVLFFWAKPAEYYDFSGETLPIRYKFNTDNTGVARNTFVFSWLGDGGGDGPGGEYAIVDNGNALLVTATYNAGASDWEVRLPEVPVGTIKYATGEIDTLIDHINQYTPVASEVFTVAYNYGEPWLDTFVALPQSGNEITATLTNTPIIPGTFKIEWHTDLEAYDPETKLIANIDPTYVFKDDGSGNFDGDTNDGTSGWAQGTIDYVTGEVIFSPHRQSTFPNAIYEWKTTAWLHPGIIQSYVFDHIEYFTGASLFPVDGSFTCVYCTIDGTNSTSYTGTIDPIYIVKENSGMELNVGGLSIVDASGQIMVDGRDGKLYTHIDGINGDKVHVGNINYVNKAFEIISDSIDLESMSITGAVGTAAMDPTMSLVFRAPGAPIRPGSAYIRATTGAGTILEATSDFSGNFIGTGVFGVVDFNTGLCHVGFGEWVTDDATAQAADWYPGAPSDGGGNVWKPFSVRASTILMNAIITSYLPLDPELLGLDPVRLPLDGKVPIFRDGYIVILHHSIEENTTHPLSANDPLTADIIFAAGRANVDLLEVYALPTQKDIDDGTLVCAQLVPELLWNASTQLWEPQLLFDLTAGEVTFIAGFELPKDGDSNPRQLMVLNRIEDMCLASDVQVTGHIAITSPLQHSYVAAEGALVSSVLPSADLQSRAYNEFEQSAWDGIWRDFREGTEPLSSYNFVDYPIFVTNQPSIKERWLILFQTSTTVQIIGENFGVLAEGVNIDPLQASPSNGNIEYPIGSGNWFVGVANRNFAGQDNPYYFLMDINGFGLGWQSGNNIRFNQDAANFPLWFIRTTLQAPPTEPIDHYTIQIRGDSS